MQLYQIGKLIGTGAFGDVFVCMHREDRKRYAAKRLNLAEKDERGKQNIENQLKMLQKLRHPNIVPFKDSFLTEKGLYIIMVYCEGGDMYTRIRNIKEKGKIFTQSQILDWFVQVALAIHYLHSKRIVHRDLKSQNLFLKIQQNQKGQKIERIRLGDFGIAKVLDQNQDLTATSTGIGSPLYMSPEALDKNIYSYKSDIWSLGCIIYQLCNLRTPFDAQSHFGLIRKVLHSTYPTISPTYSKQLRDLISQMLQKKAVNRPSIVQILNRPFIKARVEKYMRDTLQRIDKTNMDIDDIFMDSLRQQAKNLEILLYEENSFTRYPSISSIADNQSFNNGLSSDDNWAFIDNKKKQMMADSNKIQNNSSRRKVNQKNVQEQQFVEQQKNIQAFKIVEDYPMEQEQRIQESFSSIIEEEDQFQQTYEHSMNLDIQESQVYTKEHTFLKLFNQIQILKNTCETGLGMHKFLKAYHLTEQGTNRQAMIQILGEDQIGYWHLIEQALFYESILKSSQKNDMQ